MKRIIFFLVSLFIAFSGFSQVDNSTTKVKAPGGLLAPKTPTESTGLLKSTGNHSLSNNNGIFSNIPSERPLGEKEEKPMSMTTDNGLMKFEMKDFTPKAFKDKEAKDEYKNDQYLGDFKTGGDYVELHGRDHEYVDGDKVKVTVNGVVIHHVMSLGPTYTPIMVKLNSGLNNIEFEALNQGTSGPNTAELRVFDDKGQEVIKKEWNLLTGAKATLIVVKQ